MKKRRVKQKLDIFLNKGGDVEKKKYVNERNCVDSENSKCRISKPHSWEMLLREDATLRKKSQGWVWCEYIVEHGGHHHKKGKAHEGAEA